MKSHTDWDMVLEGKDRLASGRWSRHGMLPQNYHNIHSCRVVQYICLPHVLDPFAVYCHHRIYKQAFPVDNQIIC